MAANLQNLKKKIDSFMDTNGSKLSTKIENELETLIQAIRLYSLEKKNLA